MNTDELNIPSKESIDRATYILNHYSKDSHADIICLALAFDRRLKQLDLQKDKMLKEFNNIEQILGKALGYPWFKDDPENFPEATEETGVCVGEHVAVTLALEAADKIKELKDALITNGLY
jgi:hypothetical protein